jgi:hypothetical protein
MERILARSRMLGQATENERQKLRELFARASMLGRLLHMTREYLEYQPVAIITDNEHFDAVTVALWERGLILPDEIANGHITALVRWYIDQVRQHLVADGNQSLLRDTLSLIAELEEAGVALE